MTDTLVVDASVAIKWMVPEVDSIAAVSLRSRYNFAAPELIFAEVANILWKKARRGEIPSEEARLGVDNLSYARLQIDPMSKLAADAIRLSLLIDHPAYDCFYLCCAARRRTRLVTADQRLVRKLVAASAREWAETVVDLRSL